MLETVIIINDYADVQGGAAKVAIDSAFGIANQGINVIFIYATGDINKKLLHDNITLYCLEQYTTLTDAKKYQAAINGIWNRSVFKKIKEILKTISSQNSIIHIHTWVKALSISAVHAAVESRLPHVVTAHDYFSVCPNGGLFNYKKNQTCPLKPMSMSCIMTNCDSRSYRVKLWRVLRQIAYQPAGMPMKVKNIITVSSFSKKILEQFLPTHIKLWNIPNPIHVEKKPAATPSKAKYYTFVGRLSAEKGVMLLTLLKNTPASCLRFIGTGHLEPILREKLPEADFLGWLPENKIPDYLLESRALLFLSNWYETLGMVVLEAAALGIPAIASSETAATECIDDNQTGLIFEKNNINSLESSISIMDDHDRVDTMGRNAYHKFWQSPPSLSNHVNKLLYCYRKILSDSQ